MSGGMWIVHLALFLLLVNAGSAIKCYVCSNAKNVKELYSSDCYSNPDKLKDVTGTTASAGVWDCKDFETLMNNALQKHKEDNGRVNTDPGTYNESACPDSAVCRSFYYQADFDYLNFNGKSLGALAGSNERVFRSCGCLMDPGKPPADALKNFKEGCYDYKQGPIRKRYCQCKKDPKPPVKACNSAHVFKTNVFAALLAAAFSILRLSVGHF